MANSVMLYIPGDIRYWRHDDKAQAIETTSYALLAYLELQNVNSGLPLVKWLVQQRNPHGGFVSTQVCRKQVISSI